MNRVLTKIQAGDSRSPFVSAFQTGDFYLAAADKSSEQPYRTEKQPSCGGLADTEAFLGGGNLCASANRTANRTVIYFSWRERGIKRPSRIVTQKIITFLIKFCEFFSKLLLAFAGVVNSLLEFLFGYFHNGGFFNCKGNEF